MLLQLTGQAPLNSYGCPCTGFSTMSWT